MCLYRRKNLLKTLATIFVSMFSLSSIPQPALAQVVVKDIGIKLGIGDTIPEALWKFPLQTVNHPSGRKTISLNEYRKSDLLILDFWATWCGSCLNSLRKLKEIDLPKSVSILPVTAQSEKDIESSKAMSYWFKDYRPFSVTEDSILTGYFGVQSVPDIIWIKDNKVMAITSARYLDFENILKAQVDDWSTVISKPDRISGKQSNIQGKGGAF